jgi:energy-coupling factor transport system permease protein
MKANRPNFHPFTLTLVGLQILALSFLGRIAGCTLAIGAMLALAVWGGVIRELIRRLLPRALPLAVFVFVLQALLTSDGSSPLFKLYGVTMTMGGLFRAQVYMARIVLLLGVVQLFSIMGDWPTFGFALLEAGLPVVPTFIFISSVRLIPEARLRFKRVMDAQRCRGILVSGSALHRLKLLPSLLVPVTLGAMAEAAARSVALEARGFSAGRGRITLYREVPDTACQRRLRRVLVATIALTGAADILIWLGSGARI